MGRSYNYQRHRPPQLPALTTLLNKIQQTLSNKNTLLKQCTQQPNTH